MLPRSSRLRARIVLPLLLWGLPNAAVASQNVSEEGNSICALLKALLPTIYVQKTLDLPEDWADPNGPKINIFYYWNESAIRESRRMPVLFFGNSPSSSSYGSFLNFRSQGLAESLPLVLMDPRGTGCSSPYPSDPERLRHYGSRSIVMDAEAIRNQLIGESNKWNIFCHDYGGLIVRRYLELAPRSLATAVSYGFSGSKNPQRLAARYLKQKQELDRFLVRYIDMEAHLRLLRTKLDEQKPCYGNSHSQACGGNILDLAGAWLSFEEYWPQLREELLGLLDAQGNIARESLNLFANSFFNSDPKAALVSQMLRLLENAAEPFDANDAWGTKRAIRLLQSRGADPLDWLISEARGDLMDSSTAERALAITQLPRDPLNHDTIVRNLLRPQGPRFLLYGGQLDTVNLANDLYAEYNRYAPRAEMKIFLQLGHDGAFSPLVWRDVFPEYFRR